MLNIKKYIDGHIQTATKIYYNDEIRGSIQDAADLLIDTFKTDHKLLICGNGGSAADSQHLAAELIPMGLPAISISTDNSAITAIGNDIDFSRVFSVQVKALGQREDVLIGISTSGQSLNVRYALSQASQLGMSTIALSGKDGIAGRCAIPTIAIRVPSTDTQYIQEAHIMILHILWQLIKEAL